MTFAPRVDALTGLGFDVTDLLAWSGLEIPFFRTELNADCIPWLRPELSGNGGGRVAGSTGTLPLIPWNEHTLTLSSPDDSMNFGRL